MLLPPEISSIFFGLAAAISWGSGDFSGGVATKRNSVYSVILVSQLVGVLFLALLAWLLGDTWPPFADLVYGAVGGVAGAFALAALYLGLAGGQMGIVAPLSAITAAAIPVVFSLFSEGAPAPQRLAGFVIALLAVWLLTKDDGPGRVGRRDLVLPFAAGVGFGGFFIFIGRASQTSALWPLVVARIASISLLFMVATARRQPRAPQPGQLPLLVLVGVLEIGGNAFYALAAQSGRLDVAAVLASLYPAGTVLLARFILKERLAGRQWTGVLAALLAVILISAG